VVDEKTEVVNIFGEKRKETTKEWKTTRKQLVCKETSL